MEIKRLVRKGLELIFLPRPIYTTANIVTLAPNELLQGRKALVTGGTSGIGFSIAQAFLSSGASVCITGRSEERLIKAKQLLDNEINSHNKQGGGKIAYVTLDNTDIDAFPRKVEEAEQSIGKIDILVNNAGVLGASMPNASAEEYDAVMDTNLRGAFFLSQLMGKRMIDQNMRGNILNVCSSSSLRPASSAYTLSKWGMRGLTLGLAKSLASHGITVNGVAPGPTATPMLHKERGDSITHTGIPAGRYAMPEEIANMAVVLVSEMGRMVVGDIVYMTGGAGTITYDDMKYSF